MSDSILLPYNKYKRLPFRTSLEPGELTLETE
jgi:hypothetical protein